VPATNPAVSQQLANAIKHIADSSETARLDAEVLLAHTLGRDRAWLYAHADDNLSEQQLHDFNHMVEQRRLGQPIAYLTGEQEFWSLPLYVNSSTLIPRADTELLVECAQTHILTGQEKILDLGTGTGAVAIALATLAPEATITATDVCAQTLSVAQRNIERHGQHAITLQLSHWFDDLETKPYDIIVSNPPYVPADDPHLDLGDVRAEPRLALTSGSDGLDAIRLIVREAFAFLRPGAWIVFEHGYDQAALVRELLHRHGYSCITSHRDLANHERVTQAQFSPAKQRNQDGST